MTSLNIVKSTDKKIVFILIVIGSIRFHIIGFLTCSCRICVSKSIASRLNASNDGLNCNDAPRSIISSFLKVGGELSLNE